ncbi:hypothetical protein LRS37_04730 [Neobacillus sedimentimangrovi]|uniref:Replication-relaxation family protein n=1 Tax=Neobacillus sedimentimangrovi TaxID=2699460 RepID=A0ABS8QG17_9BACI|nr:hypothetical protein [Neobacillus sedimentimangrovi]MCD4838187.1 hypothetical protein [Neobacillus sedimentimangrovi]
MLIQTLNRVEMILQTIDKLGIVKIKHLQKIHGLSYRNACRIISKQLRPYINETYFQREKVIYLNKHGRELIGSDSEEIKVSKQTIHSLLRNEVYIYFQCPYDWKIEHTFHAHFKAPSDLDIIINGLNPIVKKAIVSDAIFKRNGYLHIVEVDNEQKMKENKKKIDIYREILPGYKDEAPILYFFTQTENRRQKLEEWLKGIRHKVLLFNEIK